MLATMKNIIFINGTMGVGKTTTSRELQKLLPNCAFLDGDWCWDMSPFIVNDETKKMVVDNICYLLNNYIACSVFKNIIFLHLQDCALYKFSLVCSKQSLKSRIMKDVERGVRDKDVIDRSLPRLRNYFDMDTVKIDVSNISAKEAAEVIYKHIVHRKFY